MKVPLYIFLDEAGNFDFSDQGTPYFIFCSVSKKRPFAAYRALADLKYDLVEKGLGIEYFHAADDKQDVRNSVFAIIQDRLEGCDIDSTIIRKQAVPEKDRAIEIFYPHYLGLHLKALLQKVDWAKTGEVIVFTDRIPLARKVKAVEKAARHTLKQCLPQGNQYRIFHHQSKSNFDLQIADYCTWAVQRKWTRDDARSFNTISTAVRSEYEVYQPSPN
jgi:hypothetical protein